MQFSPLAGRDAELAVVRSVVDDAVRGTATTVLVSGEAGIGKTSLVRQAGRRDGDAAVIWATCLPLTLLASPLLPLRSALRRVERPPVLDAADPMIEFDAWLDRAARERPVILVVDDVQWADQSTLDVLTYVVASDADRRLAVILTRRVGDGDGRGLRRWLADIRRLPRVRQLDLRRIDRAATGDQLAALSGALPQESLVDDVFARTGGNPYLTCLLARDIGAGAVAMAPHLPAELRDAVARTWSGLSRPARDLTSLIALSGRPVRSGQLTDVAGAVGFAEPVIPLIAEAVEAGVLVIDPEQRYWFTHPLLAEVLADELLPERRRALHLAFAAALEGDRQSAGEVSVDRAVRLADHYFHAGRAGPAYRWALRAADAADQVHGASEALRLLRRAAALWPDVNGRKEPWAQLQHRIGSAANLSGDDVTELAAVEELLAAIDRDTDAARAAELLAWRAQLRKTTGLEFSGLTDLRDAVRLSEPYPDSAGYALSMALLAQAELWHGEPGGPKHARAAVRIARAHGPGRALFFALIARSMVWHGQDDPAGAAIAVEALGVAMRMPPGYERVLAMFWIATCSFGAESARDIVDILRSSRQRFTRDGLAHAYLARLATEEAGFHLDLGHWRECQAQLRFSLGLSCGRMADTKVRLMSAQLACRQGRDSEAYAHLARAEELFAEQSAFLPFRFDDVRAELAVAAGDLDRVRASLAAATETGQTPSRILPRVAQALADRAERERDHGRDGASALAELADVRRRHPSVEPDPRGCPRYERAHLAAYQAWYDAEAARAFASADAPAAWRRAADAAAVAELPWEEAYCRSRAAEAALPDRSLRMEAATALRRAHRIATELGAAPLLVRIEAFARGARISLDEAPDEPRDNVITLPGLTMRERQILPYVMAGRTYAEIARTLFISVKTVSVHVSNMLRKAGVGNRAELIQYARRMGVQPAAE